jgi:hypothetical protein
MVFVFHFGYETPEQAAANSAHGWDGESSQWVGIDAPDEATALAWGREVAERFVRHLSGAVPGLCHMGVVSTCAEQAVAPARRAGAFPQTPRLPQPAPG